VKGSIRELVGRTITGVIVKFGGPVRQQIFLLFSDGTWFEFYSSERMNYSGTLSVGGADEVRDYMRDVQTIVIDEVADDDEGERARISAA
jgi:hypothetical protein